MTLPWPGTLAASCTRAVETSGQQGNPPGLGPVAANCACVQVLGGQLDYNGLHHLLDAALHALAARTVRALGRSRGGGDGYGTRAVSLLIPEGTCRKAILFCKLVFSAFSAGLTQCNSLQQSDTGQRQLWLIGLVGRLQCYCWLWKSSHTLRMSWT